MQCENPKKQVKKRLMLLTESRIHGDMYVRFGGRCLETYHRKVARRRISSLLKASEVGRRFMTTQLEATWKKLHPKPVQVRMKPVSAAVTPSIRPVRTTTQTTTSTRPKVQPLAQPKPVPFFTTFNINTPDGSKTVNIPNAVKDIFFNEAQIPEDNDTVTIENVAHVAMLLFVGYIDAATSLSESCGGGGGSTPESGWGKKDDEDERQYARRCLKMAHSICKPKPRLRGYHR